MKSLEINLRMAENVKEFVSIVSKYDYDIDLRSGRFIVDAKSILGIFSLDLSKPVIVEIYSNSCEDLIEELKKFAIK
ncbi:MAG: HPr family phosphocarrier protein [Clostridiales bacterium]|nr:HPr family phosphocarrier protein [Clostridiales bacterium]